MDNITNTMTAERMSQSPSYFGMPSCGHAALATRISGWHLGVSTGTTRVKGDMRLAQVSAMATFPGTSAWSPPTS